MTFATGVASESGEVLGQPERIAELLGNLTEFIAQFLSYTFTEDEVNRVAQRLRNVYEVFHSKIQQNFVEKEPKAVSKLCSHTGLGCLANCIRSYLKSFSSAYVVKTIIGLVTFFLKKKRNVLSVLFCRDSIRFATSFGLFIASLKGVNCGLRNFRNVEDKWNSVIAGFASSFAFLIDDRSRRVTIGLFMLSRALNYSWILAKNKLQLPSIRFGEVLMMCLSNWIIIHGFLKHPECLPPDFLRFIAYHGGFEKYGSYWREFMDILAAYMKGNTKIQVDTQKFPDLAVEPIKNFENCRIIHPTTRSCVLGAALFFIEAFNRSLKLYIPFNFATMLLFRSKSVKKSFEEFLQDIVKNSARSSLFLSLYSWIIKTLVCVASNTKITAITHYSLGGCMAGLASAVESHGKRKELALYCFPRALQIGWNMLIKANVVTPIKNGEFIFLSLTVTCLFYMFQNHKEAIPPSHYRFLQRILGAL